MRKEPFDPIMDEVYATRRKISKRYGNDPSRYIAAIHEELASAKALGMTYGEYCLAEVEGTLPLCAGEESTENKAETEK